MYQTLMLHEPALLANNMGLMWVRHRAGDAHHRADGGPVPTPAGNRGGWKYSSSAASASRWRCSHAPVYLAARSVVGEGWTRWLERAGQTGAGFDPHLLNWRSSSCCWGMAPRSVSCLARLAARRPCRRSDADFRGAVRAAAQCRAVRRAALKMIMSQSAALAPGPLMVTLACCRCCFRRHAVPAS